MPIVPRFRTPVKPLIEKPLTDRQIQAWQSHSGMKDIEKRTWLAKRGIVKGQKEQDNG